MEVYYCTNCGMRMKAFYVRKYYRKEGLISGRSNPRSKPIKIGYICPRCYQIKLLWDELRKTFGEQ